MSFGTFMDSLLFNIRADLGTLSAEVSYILAPITPEFVFERRREKIAEALEKLSAYYSDEEDVQEFPAKCIVMPTPEDVEEDEKVSDEKEEKMKETVIRLPSRADGGPDFIYMEKYIKSLPYSDRI